MSQLDSMFGPINLQIGGVAQVSRSTLNVVGPVSYVDDAINAQGVLSFSSVGTVPLSLDSFREVDSSGLVGNTAAGAGVLSSNTTPVMQANANKAPELHWATGNVDKVRVATTLPTDLDDTANLLVDLWVYSGTTDAASFTIDSSFDGAATVADTADDGATKSATPHVVTATIAAADVPTEAALLTLILTPGTHATNTIKLLGARLRYTRKYV